jgi:putative hydrolase of the HAD superfamily
MTVRAVVFDLWNTLVPYDPGPWDDALAELAVDAGVERSAFSDAWRADRPSRDAGELEASARRVLEGLHVSAADGRLETIISRRRAVTAAMFLPRDDAVETLTHLRERGLRIGLITNCSGELPDVWSESPLARLVDVTVFSCAEGARKPDPRLYEACAARLGVDPAECLYVGDGDDRELDGAAVAGMRPVLLRTEARRDWNGESVERLGDVPALC